MSSAPQHTIVAVGMFDGVHRGHAYLLGRLCHTARAMEVQPAVVTFPRHPLSAISPETAPKLLMEPDRKVQLIQRLGVSAVTMLDFDSKLRQLTARRFASDILIPRLNAKAVMLGFDNGFGSDRLRTPEQYGDTLRPLGIEVVSCPPLGDLDVSSSAVRDALCRGDVRRAAFLLGRPYALCGTVVRGRQLGRTIGFPTANIDVAPNILIPAQGVYAAYAIVGGIRLPAMVNIGCNPTVNDDAARVTVEAHIITDRGAVHTSLGDLYGTRLCLLMTDRLRDETRFDSVDDLRAALQADRLRALQLL